MRDRNSNPLVTFASKAGRRGKRKASHAKLEAKRCMAAAAAAGQKLLQCNGQADGARKISCGWVTQQVASWLKPYRISLEQAMPGGWRSTTPEYGERQKAPPTFAERVEGWQDELKQDSGFKLRMAQLNTLDDVAAIVDFISIQVTGAVERIIYDSFSSE
jgi:hypothetical protein